MRYFLTLITLLAIVGLAGCGSTLPKVKSFKMDIQQGNVVTSKMLLKLRPGMTRRQVKYVMGTPLIEDSFHTNRWDYFYQLRKEGKIISQRRVILDFEQDLLVRVRGDVVPAGTAGADAGETMLSESEIKPKEKSTLDKLKFWKKDEVIEEEAKLIVEKSVEVLEPVAVPSELSEVEPPPTGDAEDLAEAAVESSAAKGVEETASVLAVPIPLEPSAEASPTSLPEVTIPEVVLPETGASEAIALEKVPAEIAADTLPIEVAKPDEVVTPEVETSEPAMAATEVKVVEAEPVVIVPNDAMPEVQDDSQQEIDQDDKMIFRMDRRLNVENLEQQPVIEQAVPALDSAAPKQDVVNEEALPIEDDPSYFERILEKIGF